jgi:hypothetical protein
MVYSATYKFTLTRCRRNLSENGSPFRKAKHMTRRGERKGKLYEYVVVVFCSNFIFVSAFDWNITFENLGTVLYHPNIFESDVPYYYYYNHHHFFLWRTFYLSTDLAYVTFVEHNLKASHRRYICNCSLIKSMSHRVHVYLRYVSALNFGCQVPVVR